MPGFCASIVVSFILGVKYLICDRWGGGIWESGWEEKDKWGIWPHDWGNQTLRTSWIALIFCINEEIYAKKSRQFIKSFTRYFRFTI